MTRHPMLSIDFIHGNCPVQSEGTIDGVPFYFRARHDGWSFKVGTAPIGKAEWTFSDDYENAGWMSQQEAFKCLCKAASEYLETRIIGWNK